MIDFLLLLNPSVWAFHTGKILWVLWLISIIEFLTKRSWIPLSCKLNLFLLASTLLLQLHNVDMLSLNSDGEHYAFGMFLSQLTMLAMPHKHSNTHSLEVFSYHSVSFNIGREGRYKWVVMTTFSFKMPLQIWWEPLCVNIALPNKASDKH